MRVMPLFYSLLSSAALFALGSGMAMAEEGHHQEGSSGFPQLDPTSYPSQLFWLGIMFVFLYVVFSRVILPAMTATIEGRAAHIESGLTAARQMKDEAERLQAEYEKTLADARAQSSSAFIEADEKIRAASTAKAEEFRVSSVKALQDAEAKINKSCDDALGDMDALAAEIASVAAERIVGLPADLKQARQVVENISKKAA